MASVSGFASYSARLFNLHQCTDLALGQVALAEGYTMLDALHAIELMTPKMDAGMHGSATTDQALSLENALQVRGLDWFSAQHHLLFRDRYR